MKTKSIFIFLASFLFICGIMLATSVPQPKTDSPPLMEDQHISKVSVSSTVDVEAPYYYQVNTENHADCYSKCHKNQAYQEPATDQKTDRPKELMGYLSSKYKTHRTSQIYHKPNKQPQGNLARFDLTVQQRRSIEDYVDWYSDNN